MKDMKNFMLIYNPDKFGYYLSNNKKTYSKIEALEFGEPTWYFNDSVFSRMNWKLEPEISLKELYKIRCRQIRKAYDYVVLMFSGGSDSHNILNMWIEADCKIDEIATWWCYEASKGITDPWIAEIPKSALPFIIELKNKGLEFKYRLIDASQNFYDIFKLYNKDYKYYVNCFHIPFSTMISTFREKESDYKNLINQGKKICFVWGHDKPQIFYKDNKYYTVFADNIDSSVSPYVQNKYYQGWYDELFYWTPDLPELPIKQAHIVKNFLRSNNEEKYYYNKIGTGLSDPSIHGYNPVIQKFLSTETVKMLLYPYWTTEIYNAGKCRFGPIFPERANFFLKGNTNENKIYKAIIDSYMKKTKYNNKRIYSSKYYLE